MSTWALTPMPRAAKPAQMSSRSAAVPPPASAAARIASRPCKSVGLSGIELHPVGHELQDPLVAVGPARARDEARPHLEQRAGPDLADVVHFKGRVGDERAARKRAVSGVDLRGVDIGEGQRVVRPPVRAEDG